MQGGPGHRDDGLPSPATPDAADGPTEPLRPPAQAMPGPTTPPPHLLPAPPTPVPPGGPSPSTHLIPETPQPTSLPTAGAPTHLLPEPTAHAGQALDVAVDADHKSAAEVEPSVVAADAPEPVAGEQASASPAETADAAEPDTTSTDEPPVDVDAPATVSTAETPAEHVVVAGRTERPTLPKGAGSGDPTIVQSRVTAPEIGADTWYRDRQDRAQSVHRRANPWYRQLARALIGVLVVGGLALGAVVGIRELRSAFERDSLPEVGTDTPTIRSSSFEIRSAPPAPALDGTLMLDTETGAFEFLGRGVGPQAGVEIVSPDGGSVFIRRDDGGWQLAATTDQVAADVRRAAEYLADDRNADSILTPQLRNGYVSLVDRTEIGTGDDQIVRYDVELDTEAFQSDAPVQFQDFQRRVIPDVEAERAQSLTIWIDADNVLAQVRDESSGWSWERLDYSDRPFEPSDPLADILVDTTDDAGG